MEGRSLPRKNIANYEVKTKNMEDSCSKSEDGDLKDQISKHLDDDKSLQDTVLELREKNARLADSLAVKTNKVVQLMKSVEAIKLEKTSLTKQLKESREIEEKLKDSLQILEAEKQTVLQRLSNQQETVKEFTTVSQKQRQIVSDLLKKCNRKGKGFPELKKGIQMLESHIVSFEQHLKKKAGEEAVLEKSLGAIKEEKKGQPSLTEVERAVELVDAKTTAMMSESNETTLRTITEKAISIAQKKERASCGRIKKLGKCLRSVRVKKLALEKSLQRMKREKQTLVDQLSEEREKNRKLSVHRNENSSIESNREDDGSSQPEKFTEDIKTQEADREKGLEESRRPEESLRKSEAEADLLLDELYDKQDKIDELLIEIRDRKAKFGRMRKRLNKKEKEMYDLATVLKNCTKALKSAMEEKVVLETEKQTLMDKLSVEMRKTGTVDRDLSKHNEINKKEVELSKLKKKLQNVKSEKVALEGRLRESGDREAVLRRSLEAANAEKRRLNHLLIEESEKEYAVGRIINEGYDRMSVEMQMNMAELKKDLDEKDAMRQKLREYRAKAEALQESLRNLESEKRALSDNLDVQREKIACLENQLKAQTENILYLRKELIRKKVEVIKTSETVANIRCEKVTLEKNLRDKDVSAESLRNSIVLLEADKRSLSDTLIAEKKKSESLQTEIAKLKSQMGDRQQKTKSKRICGK